MNSKPFVKLFKNNDKTYIYDVNRNVILPLDETEYNLIKNELDKWDCDKSFKKIKENKKLGTLLEKGFLEPSSITEMRHPASDFLEYYINHKQFMLTLQVTQQCNLRCEYCIYSDNSRNRSHSVKKMDFNIAKKAIDFFMKNTRDRESVSIGFYGGEPLLNFQLIKQCVDYIIERYPEKTVDYNLTSNATLITVEIIEFFLKYDFKLLISLDGPKSIHDNRRKFANGKGSVFDTIMNNLEMIKKEYPEYIKHIAFNAVFDEVSDLKCNFDFFHNLDTITEFNNNINGTFESGNFSYSDNDEKEVEHFNFIWDYEIFKFYLHKITHRISMDDVSPLVWDSFSSYEKIKDMLKYSEYNLTKCHHGGPCIPGVTRFFINTDGDFFPCERCNENSPVMKIGDINNGFNVDNIHKIINIGQISERMCKDCWAIRFCSICASVIDNMDHFSIAKKTELCKEQKNQALENIRVYCTFEELNYDEAKLAGVGNFFDIL